jgi:hypothetical protein
LVALPRFDTGAKGRVDERSTPNRDGASSAQLPMTFLEYALPAMLPQLVLLLAAFSIMLAVHVAAGRREQRKRHLKPEEGVIPPRDPQ